MIFALRRFPSRGSMSAKKRTCHPTLLNPGSGRRIPGVKEGNPAGKDDPQSILIVLPTWVGDFVMATPTLRAIRSRFADAKITFVAEENLRDLIRGGDWMDEVVYWPPRGRRSLFHHAYRRLVTTLRRRRFDLALMLPNSFRSALLARLTGAKRRVGHDRDGRGWLLTDRVTPANRDGGWRAFTGAARVGMRLSQMLVCRLARPGAMPTLANLRTRICDTIRREREHATRPIVEHYADLTEAIGARRPGDSLELFCTPDGERAVQERLVALGIADRRPLVVISPGAKYGAAKCWMPERFAAVADRLIEREDAAVVVTCGPGEEGIARAIGNAMQHQGSILDQPRLTLGELKSLIRRCDLLVGNDAGPRHFAKAFGAGVVTIFGPTHPEWTATSYQAERIVRIDVDCGPCQQRRCPLGHLKCMTGVTVDAVFAAATELLRAAR